MYYIIWNMKTLKPIRTGYVKTKKELDKIILKSDEYMEYSSNAKDIIECLEDYKVIAYL